MKSYYQLLSDAALGVPVPHLATDCCQDKAGFDEKVNQEMRYDTGSKNSLRGDVHHCQSKPQNTGRNHGARRCPPTASE